MKELIYKRTCLTFFLVAILLSSLFLFTTTVHAAPEDEIQEDIPVIIKPTLNASISDKALRLMLKARKVLKQST